MKQSICLTALMLGAQVLPTHAVAQDLFEDGEFIGTVTVGESLRGVQTNTAASETVIDQSEIESRQATTTGELLDTIPNVSLLNGNTPQGGGISIRGLGSQAGTFGTDGTVNIVVDGVASGSEEIYRNGSALSLEPELFKTLTVTRGPANGFRYSGSASGGTIEATTKDARDFLKDGDTFSFRQKFGYESNGNGLLSTSILSFAPNDRLDALLFYGRRTSDNRENGLGEDLEGTEFQQTSGLFKLNYALTDQSRLTFGYVYGDIPERDVPYNVFDPNIDAFFGNVDRQTKDNTAYVDYAFNPVDNDLVDLNLRYQYKKEEILIDPVFNPFGTFLLEADHTTETNALHLTNVARFSLGTTSHTLTAGLEVGERERSSVTDSGFNDPSAPGGTDEYQAVYVVDEIEIGDRLLITPQLRFESQKLTSENNQTVADGTRFSDDSLVGGLSVLYELTDSVNVFGAVALNENMPILDNLTNSNIEVTEKAETIELGVSYDGFDIFTANDSLKAKLTAYETRISNGRTYSAGQPHLITGVDLHGVEMEVSYVHPAFYLDLNAGRNRGKVTGVSDPTAAISVGDPFKYTTPDSVQLTLGKRFWDNQLDLNVDVSYAAANDRTTDTSGANAPSDQYTLFGLSAGYTPNSGTLEGVELRASVENLFDRQYRQYGSNRTGTGRNFKVSLVKTF